MPVSHQLAPNPAHLQRSSASEAELSGSQLFGKPVWVVTLFTEMATNLSAVTSKLRKQDLRNIAACTERGEGGGGGLTSYTILPPQQIFPPHVKNTGSHLVCPLGFTVSLPVVLPLSSILYRQLEDFSYCLLYSKTHTLPYDQPKQQDNLVQASLHAATT